MRWATIKRTDAEPIQIKGPQKAAKSNNEEKVGVEAIQIKKEGTERRRKIERM